MFYDQVIGKKYLCPQENCTENKFETAGIVQGVPSARVPGLG